MKSAIHLLLATFYVFALGLIGIYVSTMNVAPASPFSATTDQAIEFQWGEGSVPPSSISRIEGN